MTVMLECSADGDTQVRVGTCTISSIILTNVGTNSTSLTIFDVGATADIVAGDKVLLSTTIQGNTTLQFQFNEL